MEPLLHDPDPLDNGVTIQVNKEEELNLNFSTFLAVYFAGVLSSHLQRKQLLGQTIEVLNLLSTCSSSAR